MVRGESEDKSKSWQERKQTTIDHLDEATKEIQLICCADKLSNIKSIYVDQLILGDDVFKRFNAPKEKIRWYYESIVNALTKIEGYKMKQQYVAFVKAVFSTAPAMPPAPPTNHPLTLRA